MKRIVFMSEILVSNGRKLSPDPKLKDSDETNQPNDKKDEINAVKSEETNQRMEQEGILLWACALEDPVLVLPSLCSSLWEERNVPTKSSLPPT